MAILSNINGKFAVDSTGAIKFNNLTGTDNQVLIANTGTSPTWVDVSTIIGGPYLPLTGGTLAGDGNLVVGGTLTVNGVTTLNSNVLMGNTVTNPASGFADQTGIGLKYSTTVPELQVSSDGAAMQLGRTSTGGEGQILGLRKAGTIIHNFDTNNVSIGTNATFGGNVDVTGNIIARANASYYATRNYLGETWEFASDTADGVTFKITGGAANTTGNFFKFQTQAGGATADTKLIIDKSGNVGIGTASPTSKLHLRDPAANSDVGIKIGNDSRDWNLKVMGSVSDSLQFFTHDNSNVMTILPSGNVGIGTDSPSTKLHLGGTAPGDSIIRQDSTTSGTNWEIGERAAGKWQIFEDDGNTIVTTFMSTGNVGIGTESPNFKLHVSGTGGSDTLLRLENTTVNKYPNLRFTAAGAEYDIGVGGTGTATGYVHNFYIYDITNSAPRITLTQAGNVGIGTQSPNKALTVYGGNDNGIWIDSQGAQYTSLAFGHNGTEKANIAWDNTNGYTSISTYANGHLAMATGGGIKAFLNSSGNFGIGDTAPTSLSANTSSLTVNSTRTDLSGALFQKSNGVVKFQQYWTTDGLQSDVIAGNYRWRSANNVKMALVNSTGTLTVVGDIVAFGNPSDKRLKENIKPIKNPLGKIKKLKGVTFDWKKSESILNIKEDYGFIAQDVKKIVPELVRKNENELLSMRHQGVIPILVEAIKELEARVKELENK